MFGKTSKTSKTSWMLAGITMAIGCGSADVASPRGLTAEDPVIAGTNSNSMASGTAGTTHNSPGFAGSGVQSGIPVAGSAGSTVGVPTGTAGTPAGSVTGGGPAVGIGGAPAVMPPTGAPAAGCQANAPCSHGTEPVIPQAMGDCPQLVTGPFTFMGVTSQIWVGNKSDTQKGPIMLYWHGTGGTAATATAELDPTLVQEIMGQGGMIASIEGGLKGDTLDWGVFTTGDYQSADQAVACAVKQLNIDTHRIYSSGASAGGLAAGEIAYGRSSYVAATLPNSGGQGGYPNNMILQDPSHVPAAMTMHGARGVDKVVIEFTDSSLREDIDIAKKGGFAVDCNHGGGHVAAPADLKAAGWDFLKKHPFGFGVSPYAGGLPAIYPKYCMIVTKDTPMPAPTPMM
jgi:hypothetical protein